MNRAGRKVFCLATAIFLAAFQISCQRPLSNVESGNRDQVLHLGNGTEPQGLDPHIVTGVPEHNILSALLEGLVTEDPKTLQPQPGAAESWTISPDGLVYTFRLRKNARWSNGDAHTAQDYVYSFRRILNPALGAQYAYMLHVLRGARAFNEGKSKVAWETVGVEALDDHTLRLTLEHPTPYFLELLNHYSFWPVHPGTIERFGAFEKRGTPWTRPGNFVGNGAFVLHEWRVNSRIIATPNPHYWGAANVALKSIHFYPIDSADTEERAYRSGFIHRTQTVPIHRIDDLRERRPGEIKFETYLGTYFYRLNVTKKPLDDARVRRALALSVDRAGLVSNITRGGQQPAFHFCPPGTGGFTAGVGLKYDVEEAKRLIADYLKATGQSRVPPIEILYNTSESHKVIAEAIQGMWRDKLGLDVKLLNQEWKVYLDSVTQANYFTSRAGWIGDYNDPNTFLDMWLTDGGNNNTGWTHARYDELIRQASRAPDTAARLACFREAEEILAREVPVVPLYFYVNVTMRHPSVQGWHPNVLDHHPYQHVRLKAP